MAILTGV